MTYVINFLNTEREPEIVDSVSEANDIVFQHLDRYFSREDQEILRHEYFESWRAATDEWGIDFVVKVQKEE